MLELATSGPPASSKTSSSVKKPIPFGKYLLLERINVGGMAEVFKAKAFGVEGFERLVAVKRILPSIAEDREFITMFIDEAKIAVQLTHANIAQIFDLGKVADSYFIAMEYVHGKDLRAIFDRARKRGETVPVPMACYVIMKICEGLDYAHNKRDGSGRELHLVHRDVSPQNILISHDGEVKLIDFGIAKAANKAGKTQAGILKGKFGYMSPEQVRGLPLDRRSDIFSMGIVLYELLTGERLFVGESDFSTLQKVRNVDIMPPSTYNRRIPEELERIVLKALARDVADRFQSAMDLHDDLQSFMYTSGNFFARKDLSSFMHKSFGDEIARETARDDAYRRLKASEVDMEVYDDLSGLQAVEDTPAPRPGPAHGGGRPVPSPLGARPSASPMVGMGVGAMSSNRPPPPPSFGRNSNPPPPAMMPQRPAPASAGPALDMEWDDEELATQIYDKPEYHVPNGNGYAAPPGYGPGRVAAPRPYPAARAPSPVPLPPGPPRPSGPPLSRPPSPPMFDAQQPPPPSVEVAPLAMSPSMPSREHGAPSPFSSPLPADAPRDEAPRKRKSERTELTPRPRVETTHRERRGGISPTLWAAGAAGLALLVLSILALVTFGQGEPATLQINTQPHDAKVRVYVESEEGDELEEVPVNGPTSPFIVGQLPSNTYVVEVSRQGYQTWSRTVGLTAGQVLPVDVKLKRGSAEASAVAANTPRAASIVGTGFVLDTKPSGARVFVDDRELEQRTPVTVSDLAPGTHTIRVERGEHYDRWTTQIDVAPGEVVQMQPAILTLRSAEVRFRSDPSGAKVVLVKGETKRTIGITPTTADVDLTQGPWKVEMAKDGYEDWSELLEIPEGEDQHTVRAELDRKAGAVAAAPVAAAASPEVARRPAPQRQRRARRAPQRSRASSREPGTLQINSRPWASVTIDGRNVGNTPQMGISLPAGRHTVVLENPEFKIRQTVSVDIQPGQVTKKIVTLTPGG